jgi:mitochondrial enoyl-[acyl-carrier protein] reductase / trans-2-enoyl-CoA reductase
MLAVRFSRFGKAHEVAELVDLPDPAPPGPGEVSVDVLAAAIDPASLIAFEGRYGATPPELPAFAGNQAVGRVTAVAGDVTHLRPGDKVLLGDGARGTWRERMNVRAAGLFAMPDADTLQLAILRSTAATAWQMLTTIVPLRTGDWVIQNAANSAVGLQVISLSHRFGFRTVNIVRREGLEERLRSRGADLILVDGPELKERMNAAAGEIGPKLAIDAVAGQATGRLASCLADGGTIVNYGLLSAEPCAVDSRDLIFRGITLRGYWRSQWAAKAQPEELEEVYSALAGLVVDGTIRADVEATYPLPEIRPALEHAARPGRSGKILLVPNG